MSQEIRTFIELEKAPIFQLKISDLQAEVEGWRMCFAMLPKEALEWMARLHELVRFTKRDYKGSTGLLLGFKLQATEFTIGVVEPGFDTIKGVRTIEDKILVIPAAAVAYTEFIGDVRDYSEVIDEQVLGENSLE